MEHRINHANIKEWAKNYKGEPFDGILCDPPYELGFMGKAWDSSGIAFDTEMWADIYKLLKPGGHLLAFSGSRTYHRMAVAIEDAGFEIRDMIEWVYGSGFPKSLNIGKAVDKIQGNEREDLGENPYNKLRGSGSSELGKLLNPMQGKSNITKGNSPYEGYGTALKPAHEPCVLARKPIEGTVANNVLKHGTGGLNIDGTRVGMSENDADKSKNNWKPKGYELKNSVYEFGTKTVKTEQPTGRFPANLIHDGSDEVEAVFPQKAEGKDNFKHSATSIFGSKTAENSYNGNSKSSYGSASRFFYCAKAGKSERNAGLEGFEEKITKVTNMYEMERDNGTMRELASKKNHHPTVKPLSLTRYLATLIKPPTGGRLLVPFSGSGSEMIGALQAGWGYVEGVELTEEYIPIAEARIKYWLGQKQAQDNQPQQTSLV